MASSVHIHIDYEADVLSSPDNIDFNTDFTKIDIVYLIKHVAPVCKRLHTLIHSTSSLWRQCPGEDYLENQPDPLEFNVDTIKMVLKHAQVFHCLELPSMRWSNSVPELDCCLLQGLSLAKNIVWLDLQNTAISSLGSLCDMTKSETLLLSYCENLLDVDFTVVRKLVNLECLDISFTQNTFPTISYSVPNNILHLEGSGIKFTAEELEYCLQSYKKLDSISVKASSTDDFSRSQFRELVRLYEDHRVTVEPAYWL